MRTALILLFLLAVAAVPGSLLPQRGVSRSRSTPTTPTIPEWAPLLDRLGFFDVYASPWFAAVYLLLFTSLIGLHRAAAAPTTYGRCAGPRSTLRAGWTRLPQHVEGRTSEDEPAAAAASLHAGLRARRWRAVCATTPTAAGR